MIYCPTCHTANRDGSRFCNECGTNLQAIAPSVTPAPAEPPAEREEPRVVTPSADERVSDWVREIRQAAQIAQAPIENPPAPPAPSQPIAAKASEPSALAADAHVPAWLRDLTTTQTVTPVARDDEPSLVSARHATAPVSETPAAQPSVEPADWDDAPEWVRQLHASTTASALEPTSETTESFAAEAPTWLADLRAPTALRTEATTIFAPVTESVEIERASTAEVAEFAPSELPDWLKGLAPAAATGQADWNMNDVVVEELPDWLKPGAMPTTTADETQATRLVRGEIPPWLLALRPGGLATLGGEVIETSGLLAGISGALPVESVLALPHQPLGQLPAPSSVPEAGFAELASPQPAPPNEVSRSPSTQKSRWSWRNLLPWLIFIAAAVAFLPAPFMDGLRGVNISGHQPASNFYQTIKQVDSLRANSLVLVAFDYSAGARDELDPQVKATLLQLLGNQQRIVAISFVPSGGQLAQDALASRNPSSTGIGYPFNYGETHINVGYVSGGEAALNSLPANFVPSAFTDFRDHDSVGNKPLAKEWKSWDDVDLIIAFSDDGAQIKRWIEQVVTQPNKPTKTLLVGASAAALPSVLPYYDSPIKGYLSGLRGAAEYEGFLAQPATASARLDGMAYVVIVLVSLIAVSLLAALFVRSPNVGA